MSTTSPPALMAIVAVGCIVAGCSGEGGSSPARAHTAPASREPAVVVEKASGTTQTPKGVTLPHLPISAGHAVFGLTRTREPSGPIDVYEADLKTAIVNRLLGWESWPKSFTTDISSTSASPDGLYLAIAQDRDVFVTNADEAERSLRAGRFQDLDLALTNGAVWLWKRGTTDMVPLLSMDSWARLQWSSSGRYLLVYDSYGDYVRLYDMKAAKASSIKAFGDYSCVRRAPAGDTILAAVPSGGQFAVIALRPNDGLTTTLLRWPRRIEYFAQAPGGKSFAVYDGTGIYLTGKHGKHVIKLAIPVEPEFFLVEYAYNSDGSRLAIYTSYCFGEPHINTTERLWSVDTRTGSAVKVKQWDESYLAIQPTEGAFASRGLVAWLPGGRRVLLSVQVTWGGEYCCNNRQDRYYLDAVDVSRPSAPEQMIFDSGEGCVFLDWRP